MGLTTYETLTLALIQAPSSPIPLIATAVLDSYINIARAQVAADGECIRFPAALVTATQANPFASITTSTISGVGSVIAIRSAKIVPNLQLDIRPWEWFSAYYLGIGNSGTPVRAAQQGQGTFGTFYLHPPPSTTVQIGIDAVCLPVALVDNTTPDAIPPLWSDAVPFYAAWLALQSLQRQADADRMMERYKEMMRRARQLSTPSELPDNLPGGPGAQMASGHAPLSQSTGQR